MNQSYLDVRLQTARGEAAGILGVKLRQLERAGLVVVYREDLEALKQAKRESFAEGYKQGRFDEQLDREYGIGKYAEGGESA